MTKRYEVTGAKVSFGPGSVLGLTDKQAGVRLQSLKKLGGGRYNVTAPVEFKQGEVITLDSDVPKGLLGKLALVEEQMTYPAYALHHKGGGRYHVVDAGGRTVSDRLLTKEEAQALIRKLREENP